MTQTTNSIRCLILACGNPLRGDDGVGPWLAGWAEERFRGDAGVRVIARQQWTPELAEEIARASSVIFIDCSIDADAGRVLAAPVVPEQRNSGITTHHLSAAELLSMTQELFGTLPGETALVTIGAKTMELKEGLSDAVKAALPVACAQIEAIVLRGIQDK